MGKVSKMIGTLGTFFSLGLCSGRINNWKVGLNMPVVLQLFVSRIFEYELRITLDVIGDLMLFIKNGGVGSMKKRCMSESCLKSNESKSIEIGNERKIVS